jgi:hypothetical protein
MTFDINPFPNDPDRKALWDMLVLRDIEAFLAGDWSLVESDFIADGFFGLHGMKSDNPDTWRMGFPRLEDYRDRWLDQSRVTATTDYAEPIRTALFRATNLSAIDIAGDRAVAHKKFDGRLARADGGSDSLNWQTLYLCARAAGTWKITGFVGYLPFPMGSRHG